MSAKKVAAAVFRDWEGINLVDFLDSQRTSARMHSGHVLQNLKANLAGKRSGKLHQGVLFHQTTHLLTLPALLRLSHEHFIRKSYLIQLISLYQTLSDFILFLELKKHWKGEWFITIDEEKNEALRWLNRITVNSSEVALKDENTVCRDALTLALNLVLKNNCCTICYIILIKTGLNFFVKFLNDHRTALFLAF